MNLKLVLLSIALILTFILVYSPHFSYPYPLHVDEWHHIARAVNFAENGTLHINPYFIIKPFEPNFEPGFHLFLSIFSFLGLNLILIYKFLPAISAILSAFIIFLIMWYLTKKFHIALFSILFFASLKSNINLLGLWFFTPLTLAIPLLYLSFLTFFKGLEKKKYIYLTIIISIVLFLIHPLSLALFFIIIFIYLIVHFKLLKKNKNTLLLILSPILIILIFLIFIWKGSNLIFILKDWIVLEKGWGYTEIQYFLPKFYGIIPSTLALIGIYPALKNPKLRIFIIWLFLTLLLIFLFNNYKFTLLIPYQRTLYFSLLALVPLSALGLYFILSQFKKYKFIIPIILILVFYFTFNNYYNPPGESNLYHVIEEKDYQALKYLEQFKNKIIMAPLKISSAVYPISKNYVVAFTKANLDGGDISIVQNFYSGDCNKKKELIDNYKVNFVLSENKLNCSFLKEIYNKEDFIYETIYET